MTSSKLDEERPSVEQDIASAMARYGITRTPVEYFHYKEFRYTNVGDAIAQAKRQKPANSSNGHDR